MMKHGLLKLSIVLTLASFVICSWADSETMLIRKDNWELLLLQKESLEYDLQHCQTQLNLFMREKQKLEHEKVLNFPCREYTSEISKENICGLGMVQNAPTADIALKNAKKEAFVNILTKVSIQYNIPIESININENAIETEVLCLSTTQQTNGTYNGYAVVSIKSADIQRCFAPLR